MQAAEGHFYTVTAAGIDRLCCCTSEGQLHFYTVTAAGIDRLCCCTSEGQLNFYTVTAAGIDRLCCCTSEGQLHFYAVGPPKLHRQDSELDLLGSPLRPDTAGLSSKDDADMTGAEQVAQTGVYQLGARWAYSSVKEKL